VNTDATILTDIALVYIENSWQMDTHD